MRLAKAAAKGLAVSRVKVIKEFGIKVYREYQHLHNPQGEDNQLQKSVFDDYVTDGSTKTSATKDFTYASKMMKQEFYCDHSNVMLIGVNKRKVNYEIYRTKRDGKPVLKGNRAFSV